MIFRLFFLTPDHVKKLNNDDVYRLYQEPYFPPKMHITCESLFKIYLVTYKKDFKKLK